MHTVIKDILATVALTCATFVIVRRKLLRKKSDYDAILVSFACSFAAAAILLTP